jgi:hypothetical protein
MWQLFRENALGAFIAFCLLLWLIGSLLSQFKEKDAIVKCDCSCRKGSEDKCNKEIE